MTKVFFDFESEVLTLIESPNFPFNPFTFIFEFKYFDAASRLKSLFSTGELKSTVYFLYDFSFFSTCFFTSFGCSELISL